MQDYQREFLQLAIQQQVLCFGEFTLKSGRLSPYFFNAGLFNTGHALAKLGSYYAQAIQHAGIEFDSLFGPAYKGIPLVASTAIALAQRGQDYPYAFNRKEVKEHGEGGVIVGAPLHGRIVLVDDVITAGTAIRESMEIIEQAGAQLEAVVISLNRQEKGQQAYSSITEIEDTYQTRVVSIVCLDDVVSYLQALGGYQTTLTAIAAYRAKYGV